MTRVSRRVALDALQEGGVLLLQTDTLPGLHGKGKFLDRFSLSIGIANLVKNKHRPPAGHPIRAA